jgi:hypothetical protein
MHCHYFTWQRSLDTAYPVNTVLIQSTLLTAHTSGEVQMESDKLLDKIRILYKLKVWVWRKLVCQSVIEFYLLSQTFIYCSFLIIIGFILLLCSVVEAFVSYYLPEFISNNCIEGCRMIQESN